MRIWRKGEYAEPPITPPEKKSLYEEPKFNCFQCLKDIPEEQSMFSLCKECEEKAQKRFDDFMNTFTREERKFINWRYDGEAM